MGGEYADVSALDRARCPAISVHESRCGKYAAHTVHMDHSGYTWIDK